MSASIEQISGICTSCGMCCDGTLFRHANIKHDDDKALAETLGLTTGMKKEQQHFHQQCTIYDSERPHVCGAYFCNPVREVKQQRISLQQASEMIVRAVKLNRQFNRARANFPEFADMSILQIRNALNFNEMPQEQQIEMRKKHAPLLLTGIRLFPLILEIIGPRNRKKDRP
ncbi:MAG: hypothetical protein COW18_02490 [Zetaproteobacteria bacterium CG12_big_fil_rev_8_21_14_0_65_54_13]|nr:MAG: hypothetical protein AUJ57_10730 [Zetaproteobacteria bacterium CG1_02_53_45]PIP01445.1 MAG: hypothetical protein COX55_10960 [Zetaproteobacteria bacterium CG23_combo_of_CG06-09_8_20_14_all_54_7]PIW51082.1 MAG: hypothetical protein COW18_02490 [Zetaproteobacteria bacterium CG12_big_fil_rev_8_21_14_0_65_54_13]PIX55193.1 MAG: hypothetical protein COZ50_03785 [Zetaproteobacteria bacterium CG_4_10_14_3_um_filter_54_28]PJA28075.1 MAG: hypothetical protein CO188_10450 [Zetaproteobacteria bacte